MIKVKNQISNAVHISVDGLNCITACNFDYLAYCLNDHFIVTDEKVTCKNCLKRTVGSLEKQGFLNG